MSAQLSWWLQEDQVWDGKVDTRQGFTLNTSSVCGFEFCGIIFSIFVVVWSTIIAFYTSISSDRGFRYSCFYSKSTSLTFASVIGTLVVEKSKSFCWSKFVILKQSNYWWHFQFSPLLAGLSLKMKISFSRERGLVLSFYDYLLAQGQNSNGYCHTREREIN